MIDVPADMDSVVRRWFPQGIDIVSAARSSHPAGVFVTGNSGSGVGTVMAELDALAGASLPRAADAEAAAVVLFVHDASGPLGRRALADLTPLLDSTTVGLLVNKIDVHRQWREVCRAVSASVDQLVPRCVDLRVLPTAAKLAERARIAVDPAVRAALRDDSGLADVLRFVAEALETPVHVTREQKYDAAVRAAAAGARRAIVAKARDVTSASSTAVLRAERARLVDVRDRFKAERAATLRSRLQMARSEAMRDIGDAVRAYTMAARESVDNTTASQSRHLPEYLVEQLRLTASTVHTGLGARLRAIDDELELSTELPSGPDPVVTHAAPTARSRGMEDKVTVFVGASAGVGLGRIAVSPLTMVPALDIAVLPISLVLGALCAWWLVRSRRLVADRAHLRTWVADVTVAAKASFEHAALARLVQAEAEFTSAVHETSRAAVGAAESDLSRVEAELREIADTRVAVLAACDRDLTTLDRGLEKFGSHRREPQTAAPRPTG
ncbi:MAG: hypothetical protein WBQ44_13360 [Rhodococcus sp. (in: high G+C Gram-positive bacteria)]